MSVLPLGLLWKYILSEPKVLPGTEATMGTKTKSPRSQFTIPVIGIKINHKAMRDQRIKRFIFFKFPSIAVTENPMLQSLKFSYPRFLFPTGEYFQGYLFVCLFMSHCGQQGNIQSYRSTLLAVVRLSPNIYHN